MEIPDARSSSDQAIAGDTHTALIKTVVDAINSSVGSKTNSATFSISGKTAADIMQVIADAKRKGFKVTVSGTNVTLNW